MRNALPDWVIAVQISRTGGCGIRLHMVFADKRLHTSLALLLRVPRQRTAAVSGSQRCQRVQLHFRMSEEASACKAAGYRAKLPLGLLV